MKYITVCLIVILLCVMTGCWLSFLVVRVPGFRSIKKVVTAAAFSILLMAAVCFIYLGNYYHADDDVAGYLSSRDSVTVTPIDRGVFFDGPGTDQAIVFFPGAKIEETAYAPLLFYIAQQGTDTFLLKAPFRMALFDADAPDRIISNYKYGSWYIMGHSLGGIVAGKYTASHNEAVDGVILLAAYPDRKLASSVRLLSIYGSNDKVLDQNEYEKCRQYWPEGSLEVIIEGGNHSGFGNYGQQKGDGEALIRSDDQQLKTAETISSFLAQENRR